MNFQKDTLSRHVDSKHKDGSASVHFMALDILKSQYIFHSGRQVAITMPSIGELKQLRTMYWLAKEELPEHKFASLIELEIGSVILDLTFHDMKQRLGGQPK